ncbi:MAG: hypothetical protein ABJA67_16665 [Chthonomonadales bacterium]
MNIRFSAIAIVATMVLASFMFGAGPALSDTPVAVTAISFSPDGTRLAIGTSGQVLIYNTVDWQLLSSYTKVEDTVRSLAWKPDGTVLAIGCGTASESGTLLLWTVASDAPPTALKLQQDTIESIAFSKNGTAMLVGANDNKVRCITYPPSTDSQVLDEHNGRVTAVAYPINDTGLFATGGMDKMVKVWDEKTRKPLVNFDTAEAGITGLAFLPNGTQFIGSSLDGRVYWWQVYKNQKTQQWGGYKFRQIDAHDGGVNCLAASGDLKRFITGGENTQTAVWDSENGNRRKLFHDATQPIYAVALNTTGSIGASGGRQGTVWVWEVDKDALLTTIVLPSLPKRAQPPAKTNSKPNKKRT